MNCTVFWGAVGGLALAGRGDRSKQFEAGHCGSRETKLGLGEAIVIVQTRGQAQLPEFCSCLSSGSQPWLRSESPVDL